MGAAPLYARLSDLSDMKERMSSLPEELRQRMGTVDFPDADTLSFTAPGVGEMKFRIVERVEPSKVRFLADTGVIPVNVVVAISPVDDSHADVTASIEADIPMMLKPMIGGKLQEAADKFGEMFGQLNS